MKYLAKTKYEQITQNTLITAEDFGGWQIVNIGECPCQVNGVLLSQNGVVAGLDYTSLHPSVVWSDNISIRFINDNSNSLGQMVVLTRIKYTKVED